MYQLKFGFLFKINYEQERRTMYSLENNCRLVHAFNDPNVISVDIYHEIQHGPLKGTVVIHIVDFVKRNVTNQSNGFVHRLIIDM